MTAPSLAWLKRPLLLALFNRALVLWVAFLGLAWVPWHFGFNPSLFPDNLALDGWVNWDARWYAGIAEHGYTGVARAVGQRDVVFMPLYPLLVRAVAQVTGNVYAAGFWVSNLCFLAASALLYRLVEEKHGKGVLPSLTLALVAFYPCAFYFSSMHTEALFLLCSVGAFLAAHQRRWWLAGLWIAAASATRTVGILVGLGVLLNYLEQIDGDVRRARADVLWLLLGLLGLGSYMLYLHQRFGDAWLFTSSLDVPGWGKDQTLARAAGSLWALVSAGPTGWAAGKLNFADAFAVLSWLGAAVLTALGYRRLGPAYTAWNAAVLVAASQMWTATPRYLAVQFPLFLLVALWVQWRLEAAVAVLLASATMLAFFTFVHAHGFWVS